MLFAGAKLLCYGLIGVLYCVLWLITVPLTLFVIGFIVYRIHIAPVVQVPANTSVLSATYSRKKDNRRNQG